MLLKFRLEMDVILDQDTETAVIELARQHYRREGRSHRPQAAAEARRRVPAEEFIEGTDQALLGVTGASLIATRRGHRDRVAVVQTHRIIA